MRRTPGEWLDVLQQTPRHIVRIRDWSRGAAQAPAAGVCGHILHSKLQPLL